MTADVLDPALLQLGDGRVQATIARRGASLRRLSIHGIPVVEPTAHALEAPGMSGVTLAPWPNRVEGASWVLDGVVRTLEVNEPERGHALHGLVSQVDFDVATAGAGRVVLTTAIHASSGYPFDLLVRAEFVAHASGLRSRIEVANRGEGTAPVAVGSHPYLRVGDWDTDELEVSIDADHEWMFDDALIPRRRRESPPDPRRMHPVEAALPHTLYERRAEAGGEVRHALRAPDGRILELAADPSMRWTQWYVADALDTEAGPRRALAIEPMSAPPNALRTGEGLHRLAPGESASWAWSLTLHQPESRER